MRGDHGDFLGLEVEERTGAEVHRWVGLVGSEEVAGEDRVKVEVRMAGLGDVESAL